VIRSSSRGRSPAVTVLAVLVGAFLAHRDASAAIAFAGLSEGTWQIWVARDDGSEARQVTRDPIDKRLPVWIDPGALLYESNRGDLFRLDLRTGDAKPVLAGAGVINGCDVWGSSLVCVRIRGDSRDVSELLVADLDHPAGTKTVSRRVGRYRSPRWTEGGKAILYSYKAGPGPESIHRLAIDSGEDTVILGGQTDAIYPLLSSDGKKLLYATNESGDLEISVFDLATAASKRLTRSPGLDTEPRWTGDRIVFVSGRDGDIGLWTMATDGGSPARLTTIPAKDPAWIAGP
jgi:hypothetical protein